MDQELVYEVVKWVLIVFVAGFIGYFGRHFAKLIIEKFRKKEVEPKNITIKVENSDKDKYKLEKKKLKLEKKRLKNERKI